MLDARSFFTLLVLIISLALQFPPTAAFAREVVNLDGYAEWRYDEFLIVEGQRVKATKSTRFSGKGAARGFDTISLGYEVKVRSRYYCEGALLSTKHFPQPNTRTRSKDHPVATGVDISQGISWHKVYEVEATGRILATRDSEDGLLYS